MKVKENVTVFTCDHCEKKLFRKHAMVKHESFCQSNPDNYDACLNCKFIQLGEKVIHIESQDYYMTDYIKTVRTFHCSKLDQPMYPFKAHKRGLPERFPEDFFGQIRMPSTCEHFDFTMPSYSE
jgi:hypothetical protein